MTTTHETLTLYGIIPSPLLCLHCCKAVTVNPV
ncbi:hypothetical protein CPT_Shaeky_063 [Streptomyces phage Shaeky]|uniref:Uncharacterized protein n=1 Tax=Streptomyces phage Shaeky TaxID=2767586 RepID=A0A873WEB3_9CAUD|nr:hypothetical protein CPT_Shaeky_063 [Streptomyces phage Shaeky]